MTDINEKIALKVYRLQNAIVRELNDIHIFVRQAIPLLEEARSVHAESTHKKDRRYYVPFIKRTKFARRTDKELRQIYDRFISNRLYESFLITAITEFEAFLGRVLQLVITNYPKKLSITVPGIPACKNVPVELLLEGEEPADVLEKVIEGHLRIVFFAAPKTYMEYLSEAAHVEISDPVFEKYYEVKATRDLLVHSNREVNAIYTDKAGKKARGEIGESIEVDSAYFDSSLAVMKQISGIVKRDIEEKFRGSLRKGKSNLS